MRQLVMFNSITLDGYFTGEGGDLSWAHRAGADDKEWNDFVASNASGNGTLLFGRVTYEMMVAWWPTPQAHATAPTVADQMNRLSKVVFSRTLKEASWTNTKLVRSDPAAEVRKMKAEPGDNMVVLGSGSIVLQLTRAGLIDLYQLVVVPVVLGKGRTLFEGLEGKLALKRTKTQTFGNGNVLLCYEPT